jgi:hypothetical protein
MHGRIPVNQSQRVRYLAARQRAGSGCISLPFHPPQYKKLLWGCEKLYDVQSLSGAVREILSFGKQATRRFRIPEFLLSYIANERL